MKTFPSPKTLAVALAVARRKLKEAHELLSRAQKAYYELSKELEATKRELRTMTEAYDGDNEILNELVAEIEILRKELLAARSFDPFNPSRNPRQKELPLC